jgi:hypothetical protein
MIVYEHETSGSPFVTVTGLPVSGLRGDHNDDGAIKLSLCTK